MKATGIVRRIDDLGRIVIPKEIRKTLHIRDGDPMEIYTSSDGGVVFKKYSLLGGLEDFALQFCEILSRTTGSLAVITDRDICLAVAGGARRELTDQRVSPALEELMEGRSPYRYAGIGEPIPVSQENGHFFLSCAVPILSAGDVLGCVLLAAPAEGLAPSPAAFAAVEVVSAFLGRHMES